MGLLELLGFGKKKKIVREVVLNGALIIDVRSAGEFKQGHIKGSVNIPLPTISKQIKKISKMKQPIVLCCASGMRSGSATSMLKKAGVDCYNGGSWMSLQ